MISAMPFCPNAFNETENLSVRHFARRPPNRLQNLGKAFLLGLPLKIQSVLDKPFGVIFGRQTGAFGLTNKPSHILFCQRRKLECCL